MSDVVVSLSHYVSQSFQLISYHTKTLAQPVIAPLAHSEMPAQFVRGG